MSSLSLPPEDLPAQGSLEQDLTIAGGFFTRLPAVFVDTEF